MVDVSFDFSGIEKQIEMAAMDRLESAAKIIRDKAKSILAGQVRGDWKEHAPYSRYRQKKTGKMIDTISGAYLSTERTHSAMVDTIRVHRDDDKKDVWILAGNRVTWWAVQLEFGHGGWKGGPKPFLRPAMAGSESEVKTCLEGGAIGEREI